MTDTDGGNNLLRRSKPVSHTHRRNPLVFASLSLAIRWKKEKKTFRRGKNYAIVVQRISSL